MEETKRRDQSEFNMAVSYLNRINNLFYAANESAINLDVYTWFHCLATLFRELSTEMKDEEITNFEKETYEINDLVCKSFKNRFRQPYTKINPDLYRKLQQFELKLRKIMKEAGLQLKMMDDASRALK